MIILCYEAVHSKALWNHLPSPYRSFKISILGLTVGKIKNDETRLLGYQRLTLTLANSKWVLFAENMSFYFINMGELLW